jgi:D-serine deaminase-like pyridoxal phosphate-dependent protein
VDAGLKALAMDSGMPVVADNPGLVYQKASDEHGTLLVAADTRAPAAGEVIKLIPGHCDPTVNLYDWLVVTRAGRVEEVWSVTARGCVS